MHVDDAVHVCIFPVWVEKKKKKKNQQKTWDFSKERD